MFQTSEFEKKRYRKIKLLFLKINRGDIYLNELKQLAIESCLGNFWKGRANNRLKNKSEKRKKKH